MTVAIVCTSLLAIMLFALGANVSRVRATAGDAGQFPVDPRQPLLKAIRAHGNAAEYVPTLALLMLLGADRSPSTLLSMTCIVATTARFTHAWALLRTRTLAQNTAARTIGAAGTYLSGIVLAVLVLLSI
jgi:uncharacterized membrane protein YecN with MAPEG domain